MKNKKIKLGVNIDHIATLRQVRGATTLYPDLVEHALLAMKSGASQITIHLREDRRHIQLNDLIELSHKNLIPLNLEMAATKAMLNIALKYKPQWVCLVPEKRKELTTEGGLDVVKCFESLKPFIKKLQSSNIKVSLFIGSNFKQINAAHDLGADAVEFHTGHWVLAQKKNKQKLWEELNEGAIFAHELGMRVHAGHGLDYESASKISRLPYLQEVNIGHSLVCYSISMGLSKAIKKMLIQLCG